MDVPRNLSQMLGMGDLEVDTLLELHRRQLKAGRLKDAWETMDVLSTLCPLDARVWKAYAATARARGQESESAILEEVASWFE